MATSLPDPPAPSWRRPENAIIADALTAMDAAWLIASGCFFGGGTAIVLQHGEYRRSLDVDFLCADPDGYRTLREAAVRGGVRAFFGPAAEPIRETRADQYGLRAVLGWKGQAMKFEIVREARIALSGFLHPGLGVPVLAPQDQFAEKLLANADRGLDRAAAYRDAIDLGFLTMGHGGDIPSPSRAKAEAAYGPDIARKVALVVERLADPAERAHVTGALDMDPADVANAASALRDAAARAWPDLGLPDIIAPPAPQDI